eukprot:309725-Alexandrium_andersonii.AAC.1
MLTGPGMHGASPEQAADVAYRLLGDIGPSVLGDEAPSREPMRDVMSEEEKRLIAADAKAAAKNGFPHIKITPTDEYGDGVDQC